LESTPIEADARLSRDRNDLSRAMIAFLFGHAGHHHRHHYFHDGVALGQLRGNVRPACAQTFSTWRHPKSSPPMPVLLHLDAMRHTVDTPMRFVIRMYPNPNMHPRHLIAQQGF